MNTSDRARGGAGRSAVPATGTGPRSEPSRAARDLTTIELASVLGFAFLMPSFATVLDSAGAILVNGGLAALLAALIALHAPALRFVDRSEKGAFIVVALCLFYYLVAITFTSAFLSRRVIVPDLYEMHKPFLHALSFAFAFVAIRSAKGVRRLETALWIAFGGILLVAGAQWVGIDAVAGLYTRQYNIDTGRLAAPLGNPYDLAFGVSFFIYLAVCRYLVRREWWSILLAGLGLACIAFTQSRTNAIVIAGSLAITLPLVLLLHNQDRFRRLALSAEIGKYVLIAGLVLTAGWIVVVSFRDRFAYLISGIEYLIVHGEQSSLNERVRQLREVLGYASESLVVALLGNGVSKDVMRLLESGYVFFLFRYGLVGLLIVFAVPLVLACAVAARGVTRIRDRHDHLLLAAMVWLASVPVASIGNNFTEQPRLSFLYYFLIGFVVRYVHLSLAGAPDARRAGGAGSLAHAPGAA